MDTLLDVGRLLFGGLVLYLGAEWLVKGSAGLARALGVKPLVIGLTVVAYGTSAPELAVSGAAIINDSSPIVLGNVVGSCIANLGLILGITALIAPPAVDGRLIKREVPILLISVAALPLVLMDGVITMVDAGILLGCAIGFTVYTLTVSAGENLASSEQLEEMTEAGGAPSGEGKLRLVAITIIGLGLLVGGGELFVDGARGIAITLGMSERLVGLTIVAIGTSLPELAASLVAATRGYSSLAVGNVIGSNIFNIFLIFGVVGFIKPVHGDLAMLRLDIGFLIGITLLGVLFMRGSRKINRAEGTLLLVAYGTFVVLAILGVG